MAFSLNFQVMGWDTLIRSIQGLSDDIQDWTEAMEESVNAIQTSVDKNFTSEKSETEGRWSSLSNPTQKSRERRWWYYRQSPNNPGILRRTWKLQESVKKTATPLMGVLEYIAPYAKYHNIGWGKIPKRKFLELSPETKHIIDGIFVKYMNKKINNREINKNKK